MACSIVSAPIRQISGLVKSDEMLYSTVSLDGLFQFHSTRTYPLDPKLAKSDGMLYSTVPLDSLLHSAWTYSSDLGFGEVR